MATAAVVDDRIYVSMVTNQVVAADWKTMKRVWAFEAPKKPMEFYSSAAVADGLVIAGSRDKKLYALDAKTGKEAWHFTTDGQVDASPVVIGGRVYVGCLSNDGNFYVLDLKTGKKIQEIELDSAGDGVGGSRSRLRARRHGQGHVVLPGEKVKGIWYRYPIPDTEISGMTR